MENQPDTQKPEVAKDTNGLTIVIVVALVILVGILFVLFGFLTPQENVSPNNSAQSSTSSAASSSNDYLERLAAQLQVGNSLMLDADKSSLKQGESIKINVRTKMQYQNEGDNAAGIAITFDPEVFRADSFEPGEVLINVGKQLDNTVGLAKMDVANNDPFADNVVLATLTLTALSDTSGSTIALSQDTQLGVPNSLGDTGYGSITL